MNIFSDYRAFMEVTEDMEKLRRCPDCKGECTKRCLQETPTPPICKTCTDVEEGTFYCSTCNGGGWNPDQSKWWEAIGELHVNYNPLQRLIPKDTGIIFCECPYEYAPASTGMFGRYFKKIIHRPENDVRPWDEVLKELIADYLHHPAIPTSMMLDDVSCALATHETAPVFESFGIETLVRFKS